jgi:hypothetical protein
MGEGDVVSKFLVESKIVKQIRNPLAWGLLSTVAIAISVLVLAVGPIGCSGCESRLNQFLNSRPNEMGDSLAGIAGTLAFTWIIVTVALQSIELKEQRLELHNTNEHLSSQRLENSFFEMLKHLNVVVSGLSAFDRNAEKVNGRDVFPLMHNALKAHFYAVFDQRGLDDWAKSWDLMPEVFETFWSRYHLTLSRYLGFISSFFDFLAKSEFDETFHRDLLRSQFSEEELAMLFYACFTEYGAAFMVYAAKYRIFEGLTVQMLVHSSHLSQVPIGVLNSKSIEPVSK